MNSFSLVLRDGHLLLAIDVVDRLTGDGYRLLDDLLYENESGAWLDPATMSASDMAVEAGEVWERMIGALADDFPPRATRIEDFQWERLGPA